MQQCACVCVCVCAHVFVCVDSEFIYLWLSCKTYAKDASRHSHYYEL